MHGCVGVGVGVLGCGCAGVCGCVGVWVCVVCVRVLLPHRRRRPVFGDDLIAADGQYSVMRWQRTGAEIAEFTPNAHRNLHRMPVLCGDDAGLALGRICYRIMMETCSLRHSR